MPLVPDTPQPVTEVKLLGNANYYSILGVSQVDRSEMGEAPWMTVYWAAGDRGNDGKIAWIKQGTVELKGDDLNTVMGATINGVLMLEMRALLYNILQQKGIFPVGTIS